MGAEAKSTYTTIAEYLENEEKSLEKHEFHNGEVLAMSGGTINHSLIGSNITGELRNAVRGKGCKTFNSDAKVYIDTLNHFVYPDATVVCGKVETSEKDANALSNPLLVVEVLSESTGDYDRGEMFRKYRTLTSFREYVLIDQYQPIVDVLYRMEDNSWKMVTIIGLDKTVYLNSLECELKMSDIYLDVEDLKEPMMQLDFS